MCGEHDRNKTADWATITDTQIILRGALMSTSCSNITSLAAAVVAFVTTIVTNKNSMKKLIASKKTKAVRYSTSMLVYCLLHLTKSLPASRAKRRQDAALAHDNLDQTIKRCARFNETLLLLIYKSKSTRHIRCNKELFHLCWREKAPLRSKWQRRCGIKESRMMLKYLRMLLDTAINNVPSQKNEN